MVAPVHDITRFQGKVESRGHDLTIKLMKAKFRKDDPNFDASSVFGKKKNDIAAWEEVGRMTDAAEKAEKAAIKEGLRALADRFKTDPNYPEVPSSVWDDACSDKYSGTRTRTGEAVPDGDYEKIKAYFPTVDEDVLRALMEASDMDLRAQTIMVALGGHFALQGWDREQVQKYLVGMYGLQPDRLAKLRAGLPSMSYAQLIVELTDKYFMDSSNLNDDNCGIWNLEETADSVRCISLEELKKIAKKEGILFDADATRSSLVVKVVEHIYSDVVKPAEEADDEQNETRQAKKARTGNN